jgi:hypothetical protein
MCYVLDVTYLGNGLDRYTRLLGAIPSNDLGYYR